MQNAVGLHLRRRDRFATKIDALDEQIARGERPSEPGDQARTIGFGELVDPALDVQAGAQEFGGFCAAGRIELL